MVLQKNPKKWRIRHMIACQLASISKLYESENIFRYIFPITMKLCNDSIYEVRSEAALHLYEVIHAMKKDSVYEDIAE
jgi:serine/threonine-protein phosphatase 4 regulatory subunit 1